MKILVIDDEKPTLSMFRLFLAAYGYEVYTAENGEQGLETFNRIDPEIVFTDIRMPGIDGLEVLRQIRKTHPRCQVIIITGHGDMERAVEALDMDASDFINKPVERQALNAALIRAEKRALRSEDPSFSLTVKEMKAGVSILCDGKLSEDAGAGLSRIGSKISENARIIFTFGDDFSIDRQGISRLMDVLRTMTGNNCSITISGLSYNYLRFFEMAGIDKLAELTPAVTEEPGI
ncbi:MAG: response regulator [Desulfobacterales bacterium]|nr:response regulator [Desulfobacterales bacterium]